MRLQLTSRAKSRARRWLINLLLGRNEFTIVSNNCWGAHLYLESGRRFATPFVGLFLTPHSYLALLQSWAELIHTPLVFSDTSIDPAVEKMRLNRPRPWPVGRLGKDVEIQFMHYENAVDAEEKWNRRLARIPNNSARIFFKFDDRDGASEEQLMEFASLPFENKVVFTGERKSGAGRIVIPNCEESVPDGLELSKISARYFDACAWISGRKMRPGTIWSML